MDGEIYIADGDYIKDIEVNDLRNRYTLTKGSTQKMVNTPYVLSEGSKVSQCWELALISALPDSI